MKTWLILVACALLTLTVPLAAASDGGNEPRSTCPTCAVPPLPDNDLGCETVPIYRNTSANQTQVDQGADMTSCTFHNDDKVICVGWTETHYWHRTSTDGGETWHTEAETWKETAMLCMPYRPPNVQV